MTQANQETLGGPETIVGPSLEHLEHIDFDRTTHTDDNIQAAALLIMFAER